MVDLRTPIEDVPLAFLDVETTGCIPTWEIVSARSPSCAASAMSPSMRSNS